LEQDRPTDPHLLHPVLDSVECGRVFVFGFGFGFKFVFDFVFQLMCIFVFVFIAIIVFLFIGTVSLMVRFRWLVLELAGSKGEDEDGWGKDMARHRRLRLWIEKPLLGDERNVRGQPTRGLRHNGTQCHAVPVQSVELIAAW